MHGVKRQKYDVELRRRKLVKDAAKIKHYCSLTDKVITKRDQNDFSEEAFKLTSTILDLNPEFYTVWNYRREILLNGILKNKAPEQISQAYAQELKFTALQLRKVPKCYWVWTHRTWCLEHNSHTNYNDELGLVEKIFALDARNFHGWRYRRYIIGKIEEQTGQDMSLSEFDYTTKMIKLNFSNYSALHNRTKLIERLFTISNHTGAKSVSQVNTTAAGESRSAALFEDKLRFLEQELEFFKNAIYTDPEDQSIWFYLNWLLTSSFFLQDQSIPQLQLLGLLKAQILDIDELNELEKEDNDGVDNKWCLKVKSSVELALCKLINESDAEQTDKQKETKNKLHENILKSTELLKVADPKRKERYTDITKNFQNLKV